jgi:hypothetical protein
MTFSPHANMAAKQGQEKLRKAANSFLNDFHFGHVEIEAVMEDVFGDYATQQKSTAAICWASYWKDLSVYDEAKREGMARAGFYPETIYKTFRMGERDLEHE